MNMASISSFQIPTPKALELGFSFVLSFLLEVINSVIDIKCTTTTCKKDLHYVQVDWGQVDGC